MNYYKKMNLRLSIMKDSNLGCVVKVEDEVTYTIFFFSDFRIQLQLPREYPELTAVATTFPKTSCID